MKKTLHSESDTQALAQELASKLHGGMLIGLQGELGSGKTTFTRYLTQALGYKEPVSSPSFVLCHEYAEVNGMVLEHWDLYRLTGAPRELLEPPPSNVIRVVEWIERGPDLVTECDLLIKFSLPQRTRTQDQDRYFSQERNIEIYEK